MAIPLAAPRVRGEATLDTNKFSIQFGIQFSIQFGAQSTVPRRAVQAIHERAAAR